MKKLFLLTTSTALVFSAQLLQAEELSANVTFTSDYMFRGVSQTDNRGALQGGFDISFENGIWAGTWASSIDLEGITDSRTELDLYIGYSGEIGNSGVTFDVAAFHFEYEGPSEAADYQEYLFAVHINDLTLGLAYSPEYLGEALSDLLGDKVTFLYPHADYTFSLPNDISLNLHAGWNEMSEEGALEPGEDNYVDWSVGVSKEYLGAEFSLNYIDSNIDNLWGIKSDRADGRVVFAITKSL